MTRPIVETHDITKVYGDTVALDGVNLTVHPGSVYGLVGPNGAGKTTLLGVLAGLRSPTGGSFELGTGRVAVLPDTPRFDPWLTGREVVRLSAGLSGTGTASGSVDTVLDRTGLLDVGDRRVAGFSRGMLQRLGLAAAVVGDPEILLLDEPAAALDPAGRREVLDMVRDLRGDSTVIFSSHILDDVEEVCDEIAILSRGRILYEGTLANLVRDTGRAASYEVHVRGDGDHLVAVLEDHGWVTAVTGGGDLVVVSAEHAEALERELIPVLARLGVPIVAVRPVERSLEDVFLEVTK